MAKKNTPSQWTTPADLRQQIQRLWDRGELLKSVIEFEFPSELDADLKNAIEFPRRLTLKKPLAKDISNQFDQVRKWIQTLSQCKYVRIDYRETRHQVLGKNEVPESAWVESLKDALLLINRSADAIKFTKLTAALIEYDVRLLTWAYKRAQKLLDRSADISQLIKVHHRICHTSCNEIYLRQLSVEGVDTKFIEQHRDILSEWLELTLPNHRIDDTHRGIKGFANRYGFRDKPQRLRMRSLDAQYPFPDGLAQADVTLDISVISQLLPTHQKMLITENEINYLSLPPISGTLALFGAGYGWQALQKIPWLDELKILYWGDIDTHGFTILNDLRMYFPQTESILMDRDTLLAHETFWGKEPSPASRTPDRLTTNERDLFDELIDNRYGDRVRLEQEQLDFEWVTRRLVQLNSL